MKKITKLLNRVSYSIFQRRKKKREKFMRILVQNSLNDRVFFLLFHLLKKKVFYLNLSDRLCVNIHPTSLERSRIVSRNCEE